MDNRIMYWPRGRVWGGSSALNAMVYIRGHAQDYDRWVEEGAKGARASPFAPVHAYMCACVCVYTVHLRLMNVTFGVALRYRLGFEFGIYNH